jgi:hypothetical protein
MAEKRSDKNCYSSRYGGGFINAAQFLAEFICERQAQKAKTDLSYKFWNGPRWKKQFLYQVQLGHRLLKLYRVEAILAALRKRKDVYSLNATFIDNIIQAEENEINHKEAARASAPPVEELKVDTTQKPRNVLPEKKSTLSKLRDLDG